MAESSASSSRPGTVAVAIASVIGLAYTGLNAYWAFGGTSLVSKYGAHILDGDLRGEGNFRTASAIVALVMLAAVAVTWTAVRIDYDASPRPVLRWGAWAVAGFLSLYSLGLLAIGLSIQLNVGTLSASANPAAYRWHTYFWDPMMLLWGVLVVVSLVQSARAFLRTGHTIDYA